MFCTDKERMTCQEEKMGCEGCFYNNDKNKPFVKRLIDKFCKRIKKKTYEKPKIRYCIKLDEIKIPQGFVDTPPNNRKMAQRWRYYRETGELYVPIVINNDGWLVDGYTSYLIAVADGMKYVDVRLSEGRK